MKERQYLNITFVAACVLAIEGVFTLIFLFVNCLQGLEDFNNNIFELIYMSLHLIIVATAVALSLKAIKSGSFIMKGLMYDHTKPSRKALVISMTFAVVGLGAFIYTILALLKIAPMGTFPLGLKFDILNAGITLFIMGIIFFLYPLLVEKDDNKQKEAL